MDISPQIEAVFRNALLLRQRANESPIQQDLMEEALRELYYVLDELQASEEELRHQNQELSRTRQQVEAERQRYQDLFNLAPDGYLVTDAKGKIQEANLAIATMLNVSQQFLVGKPLLIFISGEARQAFQLELARLHQQQKIQDWEIRLSPRKGQPFDAAISISTIRDPVSSGVSLRWLLRDITEHKQMRVLLEHLNAELECQVQERTAQLQQALNFESGLKRITDKVCDNLDETQILQSAVKELALLPDIYYCGSTFYDATQQMVTFGYVHQDQSSCENSTNESSEPLLPLSDFSEVYAQLQQGQSLLQFCLSNCKLGENWATILICPLTDDQVFLGSLLLVKDREAVFNDLEIRLLQQVANQCAIAIRQARLYQAAQGQVQELQKLNQLKDTFLSTVSHELRSPVTNMKMAIRMLKLAALPDLSPAQISQLAARTPVRRYLQILEDECDREISLINDLLDLQRLEAGDQPLELESLQIQNWLPQVVEPFQVRAQERQQEMQIRLLGNLPPLVAHADSLERILTGLLNNACKYTPPNGQITVTAKAQSGTMHLSVSNSSTEIPASELAHIFEKFYRIPSSDPWKQGGTGLGLTLVQKLTEHLGGTIQVECDANQLTFTVRLPII